MFCTGPRSSLDDARFMLGSVTCNAAAGKWRFVAFCTLDRGKDFFLSRRTRLPFNVRQFTGRPRCSAGYVGTGDVPRLDRRRTEGGSAEA